MAKRMQTISTIFSALGWALLVLGTALIASGLFGMLELRDLPPSEIRDARMSDATDLWYRGPAVLVVGSPLALFLGGAASALAIYHAKHESDPSANPH